MKITVAKILFIALTLILIPTTVGAQTPDGLTPAVEDFCSQMGLTGRAYGICNAYAQAMDCDTGQNRASSQACENLKTKFESLVTPDSSSSTSGGTATTCPCYSDLSLVGFTENSTCSIGPTEALIFDLTTLHMAQAGATDSFMGCDLDGATQEPIPSDQALACVNIITAYCNTLP